MKRLLDAQRVQVQPNKTGTSVMLGGSVYLNNRRQRVVLVKHRELLIMIYIIQESLQTLKIQL